MDSCASKKKLTDSPNDKGTLTVTSAAGTSSGKTSIVIEEEMGDGNSYKYKVAANPTIPSSGDTCSSGYTNWNGSDEISAENGKTIVIAEVDENNVAVRVGSAVVTSAE